MPLPKNVAEKIIIALDVADTHKALALTEKLVDAGLFKIGLQLFTAQGPSFLQRLNRLKKGIFLDLKLHDIPNTVAGAVRASVQHNIRMMTIHASGGREMMSQAVQAAGEESQISGKSKPLLLAVTVLTSLADENLHELGIQDKASGQVIRLAKIAREAGMDGVVCSPQEIEIIKKEMGKDFCVVAPGIRPAWSETQDQKRILTPSEAVQRGADFIVIGRPITGASNPKQAFQRICQELNGAINPTHGKNGAEHD